MTRNSATEQQILEHLQECSEQFIPPLSERVDLAAYAKKISEKAERFEVWNGDRLVGFAAAYCNDSKRAFLTTISVIAQEQGRGHSRVMMTELLDHLKQRGIGVLDLEVDHLNPKAIALYSSLGFIEVGRSDRNIHMRLLICNHP